MVLLRLGGLSHGRALLDTSEFAQIADALHLIEVIGRTLNLDAEVGHMSIELAYRQPLVPLPCAVNKLNVCDGPEVAMHLARLIVRKLNITPPRVPIDDVGCARRSDFTGHTHPHFL
ncbi:hypothetical protein [Candidatus Poriferisodalis sp.]|uniref:hypothetical protein n=1 Tax=Candidatus Poriferisodalis sp. TaxID=3101277 RepID=UPI003AF5A18A